MSVWGRRHCGSSGFRILGVRISSASTDTTAWDLEDVHEIDWDTKTSESLNFRKRTTDRLVHSYLYTNTSAAPNAPTIRSVRHREREGEMGKRTTDGTDSTSPANIIKHKGFSHMYTHCDIALTCWYHRGFPFTHKPVQFRTEHQLTCVSESSLWTYDWVCSYVLWDKDPTLHSSAIRNFPIFQSHFAKQNHFPTVCSATVSS